MFPNIPRIYLDLYSFWIGFAAGLLSWFLYQRFSPGIKRAARRAADKLTAVREKHFTSSEHHLRQMIYQHAQGLHTASRLFPLQAIVIPPRFQSPPPPVNPDQDTVDPTRLQETIPYLPDQPALGSAYAYPTFSLEEAAATGTNLILHSPPGFGKTTALAYFASRLAKREYRSPVLAGKFPLLLDAADLLPLLPSPEPREALISTMDAHPDYAQSGSVRHTLDDILNNQQCILLLDGVDTLPTPQVEIIVNFLSTLQRVFPWLQVITTASPQSLDGFLGTNFHPLALAAWNTQTKKDFCLKWGEAWESLQLPESENFQTGEFSKAFFLNSWLTYALHSFTPLEFTLKVWGAYAGDLHGPDGDQAMESYLQRTAAQLPHHDLINFQIIAWFSLLEGKISFSRNVINRWLDQSEREPISPSEDVKSNPLGKLLLTAEEQSLLTPRDREQYSFTHPSVAGYLASKYISRKADIDLAPVLHQPDWAFKSETLRYLNPGDINQEFLFSFLKGKDVLDRNLLVAGNWVKRFPDQSPQQERLLRDLTKAVHNNPLLDVKARLVTALANSGASQIPGIFRHLLRSTDPSVQHAACLGSGLICDYKSVPRLIEILVGPPPINYAACYALVNIGTPPALEAVADAFLNADEILQRTAASALANHPQEGHPALQEGAKLDDFMVRYASIYGLKRINKRWAAEILNEMRIEEEEWIVRDAAQQAYEDFVNAPPGLPRAADKLEESSWLTAIAEQEQLDPYQGNNLYKLLMKALEVGSVPEKMAALYHIRRRGISDVFPEIYYLLNDEHPGVRRETGLTLWYLAASGTSLPPTPGQG